MAAKHQTEPSWPPSGLRAQAQSAPQQRFPVIICGPRGMSGKAAAASAHAKGGRAFSSINGISTTVTGAELIALSHNRVPVNRLRHNVITRQAQIDHFWRWQMYVDRDNPILRASAGCTRRSSR